VELIKSLNDSFATHIIHGKAFTTPINRRTKTTKLGGDAITVLAFPFPNFGDEGITPEVVACFVVLLHDHFFYDRLGGNAGMIGSFVN
jgi:hypothetical protein